LLLLLVLLLLLRSSLPFPFHPCPFPDWPKTRAKPTPKKRLQRTNNQQPTTKPQKTGP
jgi:hypothetical protein